MITSRTNKKIKNLRALLSSKKERAEQNRFVVEGERSVSEIPDEMIEELYLSESKFKEQEASFKNTELESVKHEIISDDIFGSISDTVNSQGIAAIAKKPDWDIEEMLFAPRDKKTVVLLDDIKDPGNMGTIIRTCEAAGADLIVASPGSVEIFNPKVVRATMGSIFRVPVVYRELTDIISLLKDSGFEIYGTSLKAEKFYREIAYGSRIAFVIGNEARGISKDVLSCVSDTVKIPMEGQIESLNAAVSLAILLFCR